jgi:hypothetical protein
MNKPDSETALREWFVIEDSRKHSVFAPDETKRPRGYVPRDAAERLLGRDLGTPTWFTRDESDALRTLPEWTETLP